MLQTRESNSVLKDRFIAWIQFNFFYLYAILVGYTSYLIVSGIMGNKKSLMILLISNIFHNRFTRKVDFVQNFFQKMHKYFKAFEIIEEEPLAEEGCLLPTHPHSIFAFGGTIGIAKPNSPLKSCVLLGTSVATEIALHGIFVKSYGIESVSANNFNKLMKQNKNIMFIPGGFEEATLTSEKEYRLYLKQRKGFIKFALEFGYKVHPTFIFNENKCFKTSDLFMNYRIMLNRIKFPGTLFWSKYLIYPDPRVQIFVVIGKSMQFPKIEKPTQEQVNQYHNLYIEELKRLFDRHVNTYDPGAQLKIDEFNDKPCL